MKRSIGVTECWGAGKANSPTVMRHSYALFPLTLTLSLGEREPCSAIRDTLLSGRSFPARRSVLPFPKGEGWGEGKGDRRLTNFGSTQCCPAPIRRFRCAAPSLHHSTTPILL